METEANARRISMYLIRRLLAIREPFFVYGADERVIDVEKKHAWTYSPAPA